MVGITPEIESIVRDYADRLKEQIRVDRIIVFGSRARGEALNQSDVDVAVISPSFADMPWVRRLEFLSVNWRYNVPGECFGYTPEEFETRGDELGFVGEIQRHGRTMYLAS